MFQFDWKGVRLKAFFKKREITVQAAADALGVSRQTIYQYFKSEQLTREVVNKIVNTFSVSENVIFEAKISEPSHNLGNRDGLDPKIEKPITAYGFEKNQFENELIDLHNGNVLLVIPLVEGFLRVEFLSQLINNNLTFSDFPNYSIILGKFQKGEFLSFRVVGASMDNGSSQSILEGSIVTGQKIETDLLKDRFSFEKNQDYVIAHKEGVLVMRIIDFEPETGDIKCISLNPDKVNYPNPSINIKDCLMIFLIIKVSTSRVK